MNLRTAALTGATLLSAFALTTSASAAPMSGAATTAVTEAGEGLATNVHWRRWRHCHTYWHYHHGSFHKHVRCHGGWGHHKRKRRHHHHH